MRKALCLCGDPRPCPHLDPPRCEWEHCGHVETEHEPYGACKTPGCGCRQFLSRALFDFVQKHGGRSFDEWLDGHNLEGFEQLLYAARAVVRAWPHTLLRADLTEEMAALSHALQPFQDAPPPEGYAPRCAICGLTQEQVEISAGGPQIVCCEPELNRG